MPPQSEQSSIAWITYSLMTVAAWGVYGIFLHSGQAEMKDPVLGRYKAFLFVGIAYFLTAVLAPLALLWMKGTDWSFTASGSWWSLIAGACRRDWRVRRALGLRGRRQAACGDDDRLRRGPDRECRGRFDQGSTQRRLGIDYLAVLSGHRAGNCRCCAGDHVQAWPGAARIGRRNLTPTNHK